MSSIYKHYSGVSSYYYTGRRNYTYFYLWMDKYLSKRHCRYWAKASKQRQQADSTNWLV